MASPFAALGCSVNIFPFEGGPIIMSPGQLREVVVEKSIRGGAVGRALLRLAPGGPQGPESAPTWTEIVTPMSHVVIAMTRGERSAVVFDGVVVQPSEAQEWSTTDQTSSAMRFPSIEARDFAWFFRTFNWYALTFMGMTAGTPAGEALGFVPAGVPAALSEGLLGGLSPAESNPAVLSRAWYEKVMAGTGGILGKTNIPYGTTSLPFGKVVAAMWENYPNAYIPFGDYFMAAEQDWMSKFMSILPFPWYEFFVITAPSGSYLGNSGGAYALASGATGVTVSGATFSVINEPLALPAGPMIVARVNPIPTLQLTGAPGQNMQIGALDMSRWNALPIAVPSAADPGGLHSFMDSEVSFTAEAARNFYMLNPTGYATAYGSNSGNMVPFYFLFGGLSDASSVHRYGFRPEVGSFPWYFDPQGTAGQNPQLDIPGSIAAMMGKLVSWWHPSPLMATATVTIPLAPDLLPGIRYRYAPFKDGVQWDFYVEAVRHHFVFGGRSSTTLMLTRGLPTSIYADPSPTGLLYNIHVGNAMRQDGVYKVGLPKGTGPALTAFNTPQSIQQMMGNLAQIFVTPQAKTQ
jgi:hypothetical protein